MSPENRKTHQLPMTRVTADLFGKVEALAKARFDNVSATLVWIVESHFANADPNAPVAPMVKSAADELRERKLTAEVDERERKNSTAIGELIGKEDALAEMERIFGEVRQRIEQISVVSLTDEQRDELEKSKQECFASLSEGPPNAPV